jgi:hypothetical protein
MLYLFSCKKTESTDNPESEEERDAADKERWRAAGSNSASSRSSDALMTASHERQRLKATEVDSRTPWFVSTIEARKETVGNKKGAKATTPSTRRMRQGECGGGMSKRNKR